jgi:hypothetical protein
MRKMFWCCTAVAAMAGMAWTVCYAYQFPKSTVGKVMLTACEIGNRCNPVMLMGQGAAQLVKGTETAAYRDKAAGESIPEEPTPVNEEPAAADEGKEVAGAFDLNENNRIPAPITIREDGDPMPVNDEGPLGIKDPEPMPNPLPEIFGGVEKTGHQEVGGQPDASCPRMIPYCEDEKPCKPIPNPYEQEDLPQVKKNQLGENVRQLFTYWVGFFDQGTVEPKSVGGTEEAEVLTMMPHEEEEVLQMPHEEEEEQPMEEQNQSQYHHNYHERYSVCPYSGKCVPLDPPAAEPTPEKKPCDKDSQSPCDDEDKCKKSKKSGCQGTEDCPKHPEVDTMEYRPSDASFNEYGSGGPF